MREYSIKKLLSAFRVRVPECLDVGDEDGPSDSLFELLGLAMYREMAKRRRLEQYDTIGDAVELLQKSKNVMVITGAGVSSTYCEVY